MKTRKKILALILAVLMLSSLMATNVLADTWSSVTNTLTGITVSVSSGTESLSIAANTDPDITADYAISSSVSGYFPQAFSMQVSNTSAAVTGTNGARFAFDTGTYGLVTMGSSDSILTVSNGTNEFTIYVPAPEYSGATSTSLVAYLPAYGQFANEGVTTGGWGDGYVSGNTGLKSMVNNQISTGLSLGSFGGYAVFSIAGGITNNTNNLYGVDFIVYGNSLGSNAEPGCVQVSVDGNIWYDLAGSRHYLSTTVWNAYAEYTNPTMANDAGTTAPQTGTYLSTNYTYNLNGGTGTITHNAFHKHSWYPLYGNYFTARTSGATELANRLLCEKQSGAADINNDFLTYTPYDASTGTASKVRLTGTKIDYVSGSPGDYTFGYFDVHANGNSIGSVVNPYEATASSTGGDGFDLSWAVDSTGKPVDLGTVYYVRVYTGVAAMGNPAYLGEVSSEVTGIYVVNGGGSNSISSNLTVKVGSTYYVDAQGDEEEERDATPNLSTVNIPYVSGMTITVTTSDTNLFVNGSAVSRTGNVYSITSVSTGDVYQIITQRGSESPYITLLKIS